MTHKEAAISFLHMVVDGKIKEAYEKYIGTGFRHHNPYFKGDAASLMKGMEENHADFPHKILEIKRAIAEDDMVAVHSRLQLTPEAPTFVSVVHIFRFEGDKVMEMWDIGQTKVENSVNENGAF